MTGPEQGNRYGLEQLLQLMAMLRDPAHGCPWDREQSWQSLAAYTLEEVYEVVDAIEQQSTGQLRDELGDLLFQIVFYARIAEEQGLFDFTDVSHAITSKLLRRHPHVFPSGLLSSFGQDQTLDAEGVVINWEALKQAERQAAGGSAKSAVASVMDDIPLALPALSRALKIQRRAATVGFDWQTMEPVLDKVSEELQELRDAMASQNEEQMHSELGDLLFAIANLARHLRIEPENALRGTNQKFVRRFQFMEQTVSAKGQKLSDLSLEQMDEYWELAKREE